MFRLATVLPLALAFAACGGGETGTHDSHGLPGGASTTEDHASHGHSAHETDSTSAANPKCPVTGDDVDPALFTEHEGGKVFFCCEECIQKFLAAPERYDVERNR